MKKVGQAERASWHWWANGLVVAYLIATLVVLATHAAGHGSAWLLIHVFLLGAVTNAIVIWSTHFASTLLHPAASMRWRAGRLAALNIAIVGILAGVVAAITPLIAVAVALLLLVLGAHCWILLRVAITARTPRFVVTAWFYCAAGLALLFGASVGAVLATGVAGSWHARLAAAHVHANVFGWIALTVLGTQVSLWPTVLRTRIVAGAEVAARHALALCAGGLTVVLASLLADSRAGVVAGLIGYLLGLARSLVPFIATASRRPPHTTASWMLAAATTWLAVALLADVVSAVRSVAVSDIASRVDDFVPWLLAGFVAQVLLGALTYLLPVVLGRGPAGGRRLSALLERGGLTRITAFNVGVVLVALPVPAAATTLGWSLVAAAVAGFVALALVTLASARSA